MKFGLVALFMLFGVLMFPSTTFAQTSCGNINEDCCEAGNECQQGGPRYAGGSCSCIACGEEAQYACTAADGSRFCIGDGLTLRSDNRCISSTPTSCGKIGDFCCTSGAKCTEGRVLQDGAFGACTCGAKFATGTSGCTENNDCSSNTCDIPAFAIAGTCIEPITQLEINSNCGSWTNNMASTTCKNVAGVVIPNAIACATGTTNYSCCSSGALCSKYIEQQIQAENTAIDPQFDLCAQVGDTEANGKCQTCFDNDGIWTAFGCVDYSAAGITKAVMRLGLGLGGTVVLLMVLAASFKLTTSRGDPKATDDAKEMFTNAFGGLLFVIFGTILTRIMGIDIFRIPGF